MTRTKEVFKPINEGRVGMYVCGITSYDFCHVGHARAYVTFDVIRRVFEHFGYDVLYIQNFTDIDDKIIARANERGEESAALSGRFVDAYFEDMDKLNIQRASFYPRVTRHIKEIIEAIESLVEKGHAYVAGGSVYFDIKSISGYGALSGRKTNEEELQSRIDDPNKKNALDFALWKEAKPEEPFWESPWGQGRPGWHLECNVMSSLYLGLPFDIHGGGHDLIFPHHENEDAISKAYSDKGFVNYWIHNGFVTIDDEKMSKSLGNITSLREMLSKFPADVIRLFLLSTHYRMPVNFSIPALEETASGYARFASLRDRLEAIAPGCTTAAPDGSAAATGEQAAALMKIIADSEEKRDAALLDDFNTPGAVAELYNLVRAANQYATDIETGKADKATGAAALGAAWAAILNTGKVLGLTFAGAAGASSGGDVDALMEILLNVRADARAKKDFAAADLVRDALDKAGFVIKDRPDGATWSKK